MAPLFLFHLVLSTQFFYLISWLLSTLPSRENYPWQFLTFAGGWQELGCAAECVPSRRAFFRPLTVTFPLPLPARPAAGPPRRICPRMQQLAAELAGRNLCSREGQSDSSVESILGPASRQYSMQRRQVVIACVPSFWWFWSTRLSEVS